ncbi:MAG: hypothetical protein ACQES9_00325 [Myxococcota bacterium]
MLLKTEKYFYFVLFVIFTMAFQWGCSKKKVREPKKKKLSFQPSPQSKQAVEGLLEFRENLLVIGRESKQIRSFKVNISGIREHLTQDKLFLVDSFTDNSVLKAKNMKNAGQVLKTIKVTNQLFSPDLSNVTIKYEGGDRFKLNKLLKSLYKFVHFVPPESYRKILKKGMQWNNSDIITRDLKGKKILMVRKFEFKVAQVIHKNDIHIAKINGNFLSTSENRVKISGFTVELVGRGVMEAEFNLDTGVWSKIEAREILGWAGTFKNETEQNVTAGYRQIIKLNLHLTDQ